MHHVWAAVLWCPASETPAGQPEDVPPASLQLPFTSSADEITLTNVSVVAFIHCCHPAPVSIAPGARQYGNVLTLINEETANALNYSDVAEQRAALKQQII